MHVMFFEVPIPLPKWIKLRGQQEDVTLSWIFSRGRNRLAHFLLLLAVEQHSETHRIRTHTQTVDIIQAQVHGGEPCAATWAIFYSRYSIHQWVTSECDVHVLRLWEDCGEREPTHTQKEHASSAKKGFVVESNPHKCANNADHWNPALTYNFRRLCISDTLCFLSDKLLRHYLRYSLYACFKCCALGHREDHWGFDLARSL